MIIDTSLIAYEYYKDERAHSEIHYSGEKEETKLIDKYSNRKELPVLILEDDIVNSEGYGLKRGFYNVIADEHKDFLLIYQTGKLKAKVPVVKITVTPSSNTKQQKPKKMSQKAYKKHQEKERQKYAKGINPDEYEYHNAEIKYNPQKNAWIIIYRSNNIELSGIIKF